MIHLKKYKKFTLPALLVTIAFVISGCASFASSPPPPAGGVFKSLNKGENWSLKILFNQIGEVRQTINDVDVRELNFYPGTTKSLYFLSGESGFFFSYNQAEKWQSALSQEGRINDLVINPEERSRIFVAFDKQILRSSDCCGQWERVYLETRDIKLTSIAVGSSRVYFTNSIGEIFISDDYGDSWQVLKRLKLVIQELIINPKNLELMYLITNQGLYKSTNQGQDWQKVESLVKYPGTSDFRLFSFDLTRPDAFYYVSKYGILKTNDGGETWDAFNLLTPPGAVKIYSFAFNPKNQDELYYTTANTLYKTIDAGKNWLTRSLPTKRLPTVLLLDYENPDILYMGTSLATGNSGQ